MTRAMVRMVLAAAVVCSTAVGTSAQTSTTSAETKTFEVLSVDGNTLVVRLPEGTRELTVADDFRFTVNGQQLSVQQLKAGMKGTATVTTKTTVTPVTVTEVKNGTVRHCDGHDHHRPDRRGLPVVHPGRNRQARREDHARRQAGAGLRLPPRRQAERDNHHLEAAHGHDRAAGERHPGGGPGWRRSGAAPAAKTAAASSSAAGAGAGAGAGDQRQRPAREPAPPAGPCRRPPARGRSSGSSACCRWASGSA